MKLVHKSLTTCIPVFRALAAILPMTVFAQTEEAAPYDPSKGFRPAQTNLTGIFLQLAGSLEHHGSPAPYLRHIQAEEQRIAPKFKRKTGKEMLNYRPAYMTDEYIDQMIADWSVLTPKLHLNQLAQDAGICARHAILGADGKGTVLIDIFNHHQDAVVACMEGKGQPAGFETLRKWLAVELEFDQPPRSNAEQSKVMSPQSEQTLAVFIAHEKALNEAEKREYAGFLRMPHFTKAQFGPLEHFYRDSGPYDRLSEEGKSQMSKRIWDGTRAEPENPRSAALKAVQDFRGKEENLFKKIEAVIEPEKAHAIEALINSIFIDIGHATNTELELGILESALK